MTLGLDVKINTDLVTEPVTVSEMKSYLNIDYTSWDTLLGLLISSARTRLERYTGCTFATKTLTATFNQVADTIEIPYGPIQSITSIKSIDETGTKTLLVAGTDYVIIGEGFKKISFYSNGLTPIEIIYVAGYTALPADLKIAVMKQVGMDFEFRENVMDSSYTTELSNGAKQFASSYRRILMF
jgi:uncharacterized phiE125 gp8 family phage protein